MKIKLVTFFPHPNFGTCLQSYALNKVLRDMGHDVEFIYNRHEEGNKTFKVRVKVRAKKCIKAVLPDMLVRKIKDKKKVKKGRLQQDRGMEASEKPFILELPNWHLLKMLCKFNSFRKWYLHRIYNTRQKEKVYKFTFLDGNYKTRRLFTKKDYKDVTKDADLFITGSDQIWNPFCGGFNPMMFLEFAGNKKRIAYSSSISRPYFPAIIKERAKRDLSKFQHIAVREQNSVELLNKILGRNDVKLVVDPTMLLSREQWTDFANHADMDFDIPDKYIFCYFVGARPEYKEMVEDVKRHTGIENVISSDCYGRHIVYGEGYVDNNSGPYEWVYLLSHASMVCMDSFHATVFALKFHKDFVHILKTKKVEEKCSASQNGRMYDILSRYGILYKLYNPDNTEWLKPIDFDYVDKIMNVEIDDSLKFLKYEIDN